jgi:hypothetical protein
VKSAALNQTSLLPEEAHARHGDPKTSHEAAASVRHLTQTKRGVLACLITPAHDEEIIRRYRHYFPDDPVTDQSIRSRRKELTHPRWPEQPSIEFSGEYALTETGRRSQVWRLVR